MFLLSKLSPSVVCLSLAGGGVQVGMLVVKIGGPAYRIGMGGGAASSVPSGSNKAELDFNAVQVRGCAWGWGWWGVRWPGGVLREGW